MFTYFKTHKHIQYVLNIHKAFFFLGGGRNPKFVDILRLGSWPSCIINK